MLLDETEYQIIFQKNQQASIDDPFQVFWEYYLALFIGQKLSEISESFSYLVPCEYKIAEFLFYCFIPDREKLADTLDLILQGLDDINGGDKWETFQTGASELLCKEEIWDDIRCIGLYALCEKYLNLVK
jgi:hypothetical protein